MVCVSCVDDAAYTTAPWLAWDKDAVSYFPVQNWQKYQMPEDAGWSTEKLEAAKRFWEKSQSSAFLVIYDGAILVSWGEVDRRFLLHSARKSLANVMYGIAIDNGLIDLNSTLGDLNITERTPLTTEEKAAKVSDLIQSRSGIYLPAAYSLDNNLPKRGSAKPGEKWYYNNWDFNVNESIIEQLTRLPLEEFFNNEIAEPLNMQDYRLMDVYDHKEVRSQHPAHPFRMSARDLGRLGLLYLNQGKWKDQQIVSSSWVEESIQPHSKLDRRQVGKGTDYGYLWWISDDRFKPLEMFYASGLNGQRVRVIPGADLVVVNLVNTYKRYNFPETQQLELLDKILDARISQPKSTPELENVDTDKPAAAVDSIASKFIGSYQAPWDFDPDVENIGITIKYQDESLIADIQYGGTFKMIKVSDNTFIMEDMDTMEEKRFPMRFYIDKKGKAAFELELPFILKKVVFRKRETKQ